MKKNLVRTISLLLAALMLLACTSCKQVIEVSFVDAEGNPIDFAALAGSGNSGSANAAAEDSNTPAAVEPAATSGTVQTVAPAVTPVPANPAAPTTAASASTTAASASTTAASGSASAAAASGSTMSKEEVFTLFKNAVTKVRTEKVGYEKKAWQDVPELNLFGNATADNALKDLAAKYMTKEADAKVEKNEKGTDDCANHMPECKLSDMSKIKEATVTMDGSNYAVKIVLAEETNPATKDSSMLGTITDNFLAKDNIDGEIANISVLENVNYDLIYPDFTITATITPDGQFVKMLHHCSVQVKINNATLLKLFKLENKSATVIIDCSFNNFTY